MLLTCRLLICTLITSWVWGDCVAQESAPADAGVAANKPDNVIPQRGPNDDFVVATWNLEWFFDEFQGDNFSDLPKQMSAPSRAAWEWKKNAVADAIAQSRPDVLALQEIEGQRVLFYLTSALERRHKIKYTDAFVEGTDYHTEQDVAFLFRNSVDMTRIARYRQSAAMFANKSFRNVSKHCEAVFEVPVGDGVEVVTIMNLHFLARAEQVEQRTRQARLIHAWLATRIASGENIIVLGDTNSEATDYPPQDGTDIGALVGLETPGTEDDLIDLGQHLPEDQRRTHLLEGKHFDRIFVSRSLLEDDPTRPDLVFSGIERKQELAVRGSGIDGQTDHWEHYWSMTDEERDISDHWPVFARFSVK
jgi:endonuclease/exonuclease/phosphatase family metal-dependent hydrolase